MKIYKDIPEGSYIPKGYGIAWRAYDEMIIRCYPIPLNLIIRVSKDFYYWIIKGCWRSKYEKELLNAYFKGMCDKRGETHPTQRGIK